MGDYGYVDYDVDAGEAQASVYHSDIVDVGTVTSKAKDLDDVDITAAAISSDAQVGDNLVIDARLGTANAHLYENEDGGGIGATANFGDASATYTDDERELRGGMAAGFGMAGRYHTSDDNDNGIHEFGIGGDIGPFSFDYKSETPVSDMLGVLSPLGGFADDALQDAWNADDAAEERYYQRILDSRERARYGPPIPEDGYNYSGVPNQPVS